MRARKETAVTPTAASAAKPLARWAGFEAELATALRALDREFLVLDVAGTSRYVQLRAARGSGVVAEAVSNAWLPERERLDDRQLAALGALGWSAPTRGRDDPPAKEGSANFFRAFPPPVRPAEVAALVVRTLAGVFGASGPERLRYRAFAEDGHAVQLPSLGVRERPRDVPRGKRSRVAALLGRVLAELRRGTGDPSLDLDDDGDAAIAVGAGGAVKGFVRVLPEPLAVRAWCVLARDVEPTRELLARVHALNADLALGRIVVADRAVFLAFDVPGAPFRVEHLKTALRGLAAVAPELGPALRGEGEGTRGPARPPRGAHRKGGRSSPPGRAPTR
jgi:hypothetical protein